MPRIVWGFAAILLLAGTLPAADGYKVEVTKTAIPKEVAADVAKLLGPDCAQVKDAGGQVLANVWLCKQVPGEPAAAKATEATYRDLKETTLLGVLQVVKPGFTEYRKQALKPGVYTLRLGFQPMDGDHMGTAPFNEFCLVAPAAEDTNPAPMKNQKALVEMSNNATGTGHPGVLLLFPAKPSSPPQFGPQADQENTWTLVWKVDVAVSGKTVPLGIALTLIGKTSA